MNSKRVFPWLAAALGLSLASSGARAHDPAKVLQYVSTKPDDVIIGTNRGIILGNATTRDFKLLCNEIYNTRSSEENVRFGRLESGRLLVATSDGLQYSDDKGCTWRKPDALKDNSVPSLLRDASAANTLYVTTYSQTAPFVGTVRVSRDGGETYTTLYMGNDEYLRTLQIAPSDPKRLYVSGMLLAPTQFTHFIARSTDGGMNWEKSEITLEKDELDVALLAVNPKDPSELIARASFNEPARGERLLLSTDAGRTFRSLGKVAKLMHATFLADGSGAYVGSVDGLLRVTGSGAERRLEAMPVAMTARISQILEEADGRILVGGSYRGLDNLVEGVGVGRAPDLRFERWFDFSDVDEPVVCPGPVLEKCRQLWLDWEVENLGGSGATDAGVLDAGPSPGDGGRANDAAAPQGDAASVQVDAGSSPNDAGGGDAGAGAGGPSAKSNEDDGCQLVHPASVRDGLPWLLGLLAGLTRRRRRLG